jgi:4-hydroxybenzoyl-CoA reductase subunit beta
MNSNRLPRLKYHSPKTIGEVLEIKNSFADDTVILAGGTDVIPMLKRRNVSCRHVINIKRINRLKQISFDEKEGLRIGAAVTLREVADHPVISEAYTILGKAVESVAYNQIRNMGTLVGNVCVDNKCTYFNQSDFWWQSRPDCFKRGGDCCYVVKGSKQCHALSSGDTVSALIALDASL